jgi:ERO1-like protein beta
MTASRTFFLAIFALWAPGAHSLSHVPDVCAVGDPNYFKANFGTMRAAADMATASTLTSHNLTYAGPCHADKTTTVQISPRAIVSDACASYSTLEQLNANVKPALDDLTTTTDFFSYYRLNLFHKTCPFWNDENGMCGNIACAVQTLENEEDIPEVWRASHLGKLQGPLAEHPDKALQKERPERPLQGMLGDHVGESCVVQYDDECDERDYCVPDDESAASQGDYVSLVQNPERFTGYGGEGAKQVWDAIYRENCFSKASFPHSASLGPPASSHGPAILDIKAVLQAAGRQQKLEQQRQLSPKVPFVAQSGLENDEECLEKRVFYRVISGMHASISTHICHDYLNQTTGEWGPNVGCYVERLHSHPDRISNLYFNYALLTRAVAKLGPYFRSPNAYTFCTGDASEDAATRAKVLEVTERASSVPQIFDESLMFKNGEGPSLKEDFRNRFRNVSRLMDCVGCDKCRLWGKLQTAGYGAALKVLFEFDNDVTDIPALKRTELVALFNTYARISHSLAVLDNFRDVVDGSVEDDTGKVSEVQKVYVIPERVKQPHTPFLSEAAEAGRRGSPEKSGRLDEDDLEEEDEKPRELTIKEQFYDELERVIKAYKFVMVQWLSVPKTM